MGLKIHVIVKDGGPLSSIAAPLTEPLSAAL
jgi:hypothetical protein|uniref:Uncharacterized protein n=1 Tax=Siphoviridae sp. ctP6113 TaxID=2826318 RepID=A0A8S5MU85_9CAUD|nr:MAG TPA: hypothetical protein [Siphoviridae sp. ctP6113]